MKTHTKKSNKKKLIIVATAIVLLLIALFLSSYIYLYRFNGTLLNWQPFPKPSATTSTINYQPPTKEQQSSGNSIKSGSTTSPTTPSQTGATGPTTPTTTTPSLSTVQVVITAANQSDSSSPLIVAAYINTLTSQGTCTLTLTRQGYQTFTQTVAVQASSSSSTCEHFNVPASSLSSGKWSLTVAYSSTSAQGTATQDVIIK